MANEIRLEKPCTKCAIIKPLSGFSQNRAAGDGLASECKACKKISAAARYAANKEKYDARNKAHYQANREKTLARQKEYVKNRDPAERTAYMRQYRLMSSYGISVADFKAMEALQNGLCYICGQEEIRHASLVVDHDHATGKVRKLLCTPCNTSLGFANDDPVRLRAMADYVEAHHQ